MRLSIAALVAAGACASAPAAQAQLAYDDMTTRPGADYRVFIVPPPPPPGRGPAISWGVCRIACNEDFNCRAWTYEYPPLGGVDGVCHLKDSVPAPAADPCCVSGEKPVTPVMPWGEGRHEYNSFRDGDVMRRFAIQRQDDKAWFCEYACFAEVDWLTGDRCRSWSWEITPNKDHICTLMRDESGANYREGDVSGKIIW